ncbi:MAG: TatD family nuclease-associated radical SAM protein [Candidatus Bathyarchaeota archaeon]|nr:TatD family nuclease-associated radical SAM protein [Candidatus Bathyarchaeota archaeon]
MSRGEKPSIVYWLDDNLYLNITNRCSNNCWFCFRNFKQGVGGFNLKLEREPTAAEVKAALESALALRRWREVVFCGFGEPTARLDVLLEVARWIRERCGGTITIRVNTNGHGYVLNKGREVAQEMRDAGVSKVSVSLNGHDEASYAENCRPMFAGGLSAVLDFVKKAKAAGLDVEVSAVRMPEVDMEKVREVAEALGVQLRVREYIPCFW